MIKRFAGMAPTRSRAVAHDGIVYAVATAKNKAAALYEQTKDALDQIDGTLAEAGSSKSRILRATVYITDMSRKPEMDRAWDEWVDRANPPQRACIGVTLADRDLVEILVTAAQG
jgi:enamine deaminase RidA (YjgF/YER057c/UK114 family)